MYKKITIHLILILIHLSFSLSVDKLNLSNRISILNERAYLTFPDSAMDTALSYSIMSHPANSNKESRIEYNNGAERLVFFAEELLLFGNDSIYEQIKNDKYEMYNFEYSIVKKNSTISAFQSTPTKWDSTSDGILINSLTTMLADSTLIRVNAIINPNAYKSQRDNYISLTNRVFSTIEKGSRKLNLGARKEIHHISGTNFSFRVGLPKNMVAYVDKGHDFQVLRIINYANYSSSSHKSIEIYTGNHPSSYYHQFGYNDSTTAVQRINLFGKNIDFQLFEDKENGRLLVEKIVGVDDISDGMNLHIAMISYNLDDLKELSDIVGTMSLLNNNTEVEISFNPNFWENMEYGEDKETSKLSYYIFLSLIIITITLILRFRKKKK